MGLGLEWEAAACQINRAYEVIDTPLLGDSADLNVGLT